jgi:hypothetical protein
VATVVVVMLAFNCMVEAASAILSARYAVLIERSIASSGSADDIEIRVGYVLGLSTALVSSGVFAATGITFLAWLFYARANAEMLAPWRHRRAKPWLIFGWIVPIVCLWFPRQIMDDIWVSSKPGELGKASGFAFARRPVLVWVWWNALLVALLVDVAVEPLIDVDYLPSLRGAARIEVAGAGLYIVAAVLAAAVVFKITGFQEARRSAQFTEPETAAWPAESRVTVLAGQSIAGGVAGRAERLGGVPEDGVRDEGQAAARDDAGPELDGDAGPARESGRVDERGPEQSPEAGAEGGRR